LKNRQTFFRFACRRNLLFNTSRRNQRSPRFYTEFFVFGKQFEKFLLRTTRNPRPSTHFGNHLLRSSAAISEALDYDTVLNGI